MAAIRASTEPDRLATWTTNLLSELPGLAIGLVTLVWMLSSFKAL